MHNFIRYSLTLVGRKVITSGDFLFEYTSGETVRDLYSTNAKIMTHAIK